MTGHELFPIINCADLPAACAFYERVFRAVQTYRFPETGEPAYLVLQVGDGQLGLGVGTTEALYGDTPLPATGHAVDLCVYVEDLPAVVEAARRSGAAVPVDAQDMPWGETVAYVRDPEGTMLLVVQSGQD
ncbi:UNVERIFIED_CONTAM: VOC family protein [Kocuria sp. CPCC 205316]|uniref:VOC family protein n=1 Tax=Kocuria TaxID=57493 RepID=UPI0036DA8CB7